MKVTETKPTETRPKTARVRPPAATVSLKAAKRGAKSGEPATTMTTRTTLGETPPSEAIAAFSAEEIAVRPDELERDEKQPRRRFNEAKLEEMKKSIIWHGGLIHPIVARRKDGKLLIVAGERRWRGATRAWAEGREIMLAVRVVDKTDEAIRLIQLEENARREDLHPLDEAAAYQELLDTLKVNGRAIAIAELAERVGKEAGALHQRLRLCALCEEAKAEFEADAIPIGHALELASKKHKPAAEAYLRLVKAGGEAVKPLFWEEQKPEVEKPKTPKVKTAQQV